MAVSVDPDQTAPLGAEEQSDLDLHCLLGFNLKKKTTKKHILRITVLVFPSLNVDKFAFLLRKFFLNLISEW